MHKEFALNPHADASNIGVMAPHSITHALETTQAAVKWHHSWHKKVSLRFP